MHVLCSTAYVVLDRVCRARPCVTFSNACVIFDRICHSQGRVAFIMFNRVCQCRTRLDRVHRARPRVSFSNACVIFNHVCHSQPRALYVILDHAWHFRPLISCVVLLHGSVIVCLNHKFKQTVTLHVYCRAKIGSGRSEPGA